MKRIVLTLLMLLLFANSIWAGDIVATWETQNSNPLKLSYRDDSHIRMESSPDGYLLITDGKTYSLNRQDDRWNAIDMDQMSGMLANFRPGNKDLPQDDTQSQTFQLKDTGKTEVVAGYQGRIYLVEEEQSDGSLREVEIVMSTHADIRKLNQGWMALSANMSKIVGEDIANDLNQAYSEMHKEKYGGLLRYSDNFKLVKLEKKSLSEDYFKLPQGVNMLQMPKMSIQAAQDTPPSKADDTEDEPEETPPPANNTSQSPSNDIKEDVKKEVGKFLKSLF